MPVAALFVQPGGVYSSLGCDTFDIERDARTFDLSCPVVAHPPCRSWGRLSQWAKPRQDERDLAWWALHVVRHCGGVLEHPASSRLWKEAGIAPGRADSFGGVLVPVDQRWYGHRAQKRTGLYVVRSEFRPAFDLARPLVGVEFMCRQERERTPVALARALVEVARAARC